MPVYDRKCDHCGKLLLDVVEPINSPDLPCTCGHGHKVRVWLPGNAPTAISDSIPGGVEIKNGICNLDGTPRTYYSHSEMRAEAKRRGVVNLVRHLGTRDSDKSKHTTKWY